MTLNKLLLVVLLIVVAPFVVRADDNPNSDPRGHANGNGNGHGHGNANGHARQDARNGLEEVAGVVPEPGTALFGLSIGAICLGARRRRPIKVL